MTRDEILAHIARNELGIKTLETRNSDSLDFHDVGVASVKDALNAAYDAGIVNRVDADNTPATPEQYAKLTAQVREWIDAKDPMKNSLAALCLRSMAGDTPEMCFRSVANLLRYLRTDMMVLENEINEIKNS